MIINNNHIVADEGKVLQRISDNWIAGDEVYLGCTYYINGIELDTPLLELPEHYEEIDKPIEIEDDYIILDENKTISIKEEDIVLLEEIKLSEITEVVIDYPEVTLSDFYKLKQEIEKLSKEITTLKSGGD